MPDAFRNWARRHTPALATLYLLLLTLISAGSLAVLFEWRGTERAVAKIERFCDGVVRREAAEWEARWEKAERLFAEGDAAGAELALDALLADIPVRSRLGPDGQTRSRVLKRLVDAYLAQDKRRRAAQACEALLLLNPDYAEETFLYGRTLLATGEREEGERQLLKSFELDPNYTPVVEFLIAHFAETARMKEALEVHDRYQNAFSVALGALEPANGVVELLEGDARIAARKYLPVLNPPEREVLLALGAPEAADPERTVDGLRLAFTLPPECGRFEVLSIRLLPRRVVGGENPDPLAEVRDFTGAERAETTVENATGSLTIERRFVLSLNLPAPVPLEEIDAIAVRTSAAKRLSDAARASVERARKQMELDTKRNAERP